MPKSATRNIAAAPARLPDLQSSFSIILAPTATHDNSSFRNGGHCGWATVTENCEVQNLTAGETLNLKLADWHEDSTRARVVLNRIQNSRFPEHRHNWERLVPQLIEHAFNLNNLEIVAMRARIRPVALTEDDVLQVATCHEISQMSGAERKFIGEIYPQLTHMPRLDLHVPMSATMADAPTQRPKIDQNLLAIVSRDEYRQRVEFGLSPEALKAWHATGTPVHELDSLAGQLRQCGAKGGLQLVAVRLFSDRCDTVQPQEDPTLKPVLARALLEAKLPRNLSRYALRKIQPE